MYDEGADGIALTGSRQCPFIASLFLSPSHDKYLKRVASQVSKR